MDNPDIIVCVVEQLSALLCFRPDDYKTTLGVNRLWHRIAKNAQYERDNINVISTLVLRNPDIMWNFNGFIDKLSMDLILHYFCVDGIFNNEKIVSIICDGDEDDDEIENAKSVFYEDISLNPRLTHDFILNNYQPLDWLTLVENPRFTENLYHLTLETMCEWWQSNYVLLYYNHNFTIQFIESQYVRDIIGWKMRLFQNGDDSVIADDNILWHHIVIQHYPIRCDLFIKYLQEFRVYAHLILPKMNITLEFAREYLVQLGDSSMLCNKVITCDFIEEHIDNIKKMQYYASHLSRNPNLTQTFINAHPEIRFNWTEIALRNRDLALVEKNIDELRGGLLI